jgi:hypothetical protein
MNIEPQNIEDRIANGNTRGALQHSSFDILRFINLFIKLIRSQLQNLRKRPEGPAFNRPDRQVGIVVRIKRAQKARHKNK